MVRFSCVCVLSSGHCTVRREDGGEKTLGTLISTEQIPRRSADCLAGSTGRTVKSSADLHGAKKGSCALWLSV